MEFVVVAILCFFALIGILTAVSWVEMCVCASENRKNYLIIPCAAECRDIDLVITGAVVQAKHISAAGDTQIIILDLGIDEQSKNVVKIKTTKYENISLLTPEQLKNYFLYSKI